MSIRLRTPNPDCLAQTPSSQRSDKGLDVRPQTVAACREAPAAQIVEQVCFLGEIIAGENDGNVQRGDPYRDVQPAVDTPTMVDIRIIDEGGNTVGGSGIFGKVWVNKE